MSTLNITTKLLAGMLLFLGASTTSAQEVSLGPWSAAEMVTVPSETGQIQLERQTRTLEVQRPSGREYPYSVDMLFEPNSGQLWIGRAYDKYCFVDGKIVGTDASGGDLRMRANKDIVRGNKQSLIDQAMERITNLEASPSYDEDVWIKLAPIFGYWTLTKRGAQFTPSVTSRSIDVIEDGIRLGFTAATGKEVSLTLNREMIPIHAELDGEPWDYQGDERRELG